MSCLALCKVTRRFTRDAAPVVADVSLTVQPGELVALLGPSGVGKSTLLKMIAGIEHPDSGDIVLDGQSLLPVPAHQRSVTLMFQQPYLFPFMRVGENVAFGLRMQRQPKQAIAAAVADALALVELAGFERRRPADLSGGEQQRVALARALVTRPRVLLLDEPLSSLDTAVRHTLQEAIRRIQRDLHLTTMLVTHDLQEALTMADRIALLQEGGTLEVCATPTELYLRPPTVAAARFMGVSAFFAGEPTSDGFRLANGVWVSCAAPPLAGATVLLAIRPEHLRLVPAAAENTLPATVRGVVYRGEASDIDVETAVGVLRVRHPGLSGQWQPGVTGYVQLPAAHVFYVTTTSPPRASV